MTTDTRDHSGTPVRRERRDGRTGIRTGVRLPARVDEPRREVERREIEDVEDVVFLPGARELLSSLPPGRWTIATSCTRALAEVRLRAARLPIPERLVTSSDVSHGKPHPEPFLKAAAGLNVSAGDCVVFEDAPKGVEAALNAGMKCVVLTTMHEKEEFLQYPNILGYIVDYRDPSLDELF